jgi:5-methylcytosine-specific restriction endonuclease McrA
MKGRIIWNKGMRGQYHFSKQIVEKMRERMLGKNNPAYKNGLSRTDRAYINEYRKKYWHEHGLSKKYISDCNISKSKEYKAAQRHKRRALEFNGGDLTIQVIQKVYEDNIKKYGTLTCYLCLDPIQFKNDHLEHKTPLSRGGTNNQNNLDVACQRCNCKKNDKTVEEYSAYLLKERNLQS